MKDLLHKLPKGTIFAIIGAINTYCFAKGYIGEEEATLISAISVAFATGINAITKGKSKVPVTDE